MLCFPAVCKVTFNIMSFEDYVYEQYSIFMEAKNVSRKCKE